MWMLAAGSYVLNKSMRLFIFSTAALNRSFSLKQGKAWHSGTQKMLNNPLGIFLPCVIGPRWNCHAMIARLGPFAAERHIRVDAATLSSADSWSAVVYDGGFHTIATFSSNEAESRHACDVRPGRYSIFLRYYDQGQDVCAPSVYVDGELLTEASRIEDEKKQYAGLLASIKGKRPLFYFLMHFYVFYLLRHQSRFSRDWIKKEFLPVGNPHTEFFYGYLPKGGCITIDCQPALFDNALVFLSTYNEASFPEVWTQIQHGQFSLSGADNPGAYLVRIVAKKRSAGFLENVKDMIRISCA